VSSLARATADSSDAIVVAEVSSAEDRAEVAAISLACDKCTKPPNVSHVHFRAFHASVPAKNPPRTLDFGSVSVIIFINRHGEGLFTRAIKVTRENEFADAI
jgi:hypothetical protein